VRGRALPLTVLGTTGSQYLVCGMQGFQAHFGLQAKFTLLRRKNPTLLCVVDDLGTLEFYETMLDNHGYDVLLAKDGPHAVARAAELKRHSATLPVIMISGCVPLLEGTRHPVDALSPKAFRLRKFRPESDSCCMKRAAECAVS
jgi:hypothetical protein